MLHHSHWCHRHRPRSPLGPVYIHGSLSENMYTTPASDVNEYSNTPDFSFFLLFSFFVGSS
jgi:hypothetical protein